MTNNSSNPFSNLGISDTISQALIEKGYLKASPIQSQAIPMVLAGRDLMAAAQTGTGKTAAFLVPILQKLSLADKPVRENSVKVLILTPTRELAVQVYESACFYGKNLSLRYLAVFGGSKINPQIKRLQAGADILVATPGRLLDLIGQKAVQFDQLETVVLDEADRMLDMGFINDIKKIMRLLPRKRQNLMFSATFSPEVRALTKDFLNRPVEIDVSPPNSTAEKVKQIIYTVSKIQKASLLSRLILDNSWSQVMVFSRTKHGANRIVEKLYEDGILAVAIHSNKSQSVRTKALASFKQGLVNVLVATDVAARGLDIAQLPCVINYDLPNMPQDYIHRIGRTGRAGHKGEACSLVTPEDEGLLRDIQKIVKIDLPIIHNAGYSKLEDAPYVPIVRKEKKMSPRKEKASESPKPRRSRDAADVTEFGEERSVERASYDLAPKPKRNNAQSSKPSRAQGPQAGRTDRKTYAPKVRRDDSARPPRITRDAKHRSEHSPEYKAYVTREQKRGGSVESPRVTSNAQGRRADSSSERKNYAPKGNARNPRATTARVEGARADHKPERKAYAGSGQRRDNPRSGTTSSAGPRATYSQKPRANSTRRPGASTSSRKPKSR